PTSSCALVFAGRESMYSVWFSFFPAWLCKLLVTRYGGLRGFLFLRPFFLGLVLGDCLMASFWALVGAATKVEYPPFSGIACARQLSPFLLLPLLVFKASRIRSRSRPPPRLPVA